ncbi:MAG: sel1 repeat family protein [Chlorobiaceae bacterium]|nr:sel1 repeat family protein [Chlorobiaceae bacterium]NTV61167.1 sel1 repeat family protein [Chlorobiaceae bacterium]
MNSKPLIFIAFSMLLSVPVSAEIPGRFQTAMAEAEKGNPMAQNKVGTFYKIGIGTEQNDTDAVRWYRASAEQGYAEAQFNLGEMYEEGRGVVRDIAEAVDWYKKACDNGWKCGCTKYRQLTDGVGRCN